MQKKLVVSLLSSALIAGSLISPVSAEKTQVVESNTSVETSTVSEGQDISREELVSKVRELFPNKFDFVSDEDFEFMYNDFYNEESFDVSFYKRLGDDKRVYGDFQFNSSKELIGFYYNDDDLAYENDIFPPKVEFDQAKEIAQKFIDSIGLTNIEVEENPYQNISVSPLTEPIEYNFIITTKENGITVKSQQGDITVSGNGEITRYFNRNSTNDTFEDASNILTLESIKQQILEDFNLELVYLIDWNYRNDETIAKLAYVLNPSFEQVNAQDGSYLINREFVSELNSNQKYKKIGESPVENKPLTKDEAEEMALELLEPVNDEVKLTIRGTNENETRYGFTTYDVSYMYELRNSGSGSSVDFNKETGDLIRYYRDEYNILFSEGEDSEPISEEDALEIALDYVKQYAPVIANELVYYEDGSSLNQSYYSYRYGEDLEYMFHFPQYKDGIRIQGNGASVSVSKTDGTLTRMSIDSHVPDQWPNLEDAVSLEKAMSDFQDNLTLELVYDLSLDYKEGDVKHHIPYYDVSFSSEVLYSFYDGIKGEWVTRSYVADQPEMSVEVSHPWAEKELNYLIKKGIISPNENGEVSPDEAVTVAEGLDVLIKSLNRYYDIEDSEGAAPTFSNIDSDHEYFYIIERAVQQGIINSEPDTFAVDEALTREQLTYWYVKALGLQKMAEQQNLYLIDFADSEQIADEYQSYVAIANSLGLITANENGQFRPQESVTLAEISVSVIRLANMMNEFK
ncbi:S-layer homology domain-containing protein [Chengkuizengella axinellae]|uniref:S-layer homology domain-containing protein n=1 Tax=Chengkuizengella axinellae TaxID=3064388 RepID=A0ABT9IWW3_9BACL|nr:S-layer homology domain-containing protein [Chengkuizengella sp. 2205SS18-9]MDP5273848.1 S-layer homology domain-containing protein [Chengkuizengella sp. 2205SS18-9]